MARLLLLPGEEDGGPGGGQCCFFERCEASKGARRHCLVRSGPVPKLCLSIETGMRGESRSRGVVATINGWLLSHRGGWDEAVCQVHHGMAGLVRDEREGEGGEAIRSCSAGLFKRAGHTHQVDWFACSKAGVAAGNNLRLRALLPSRAILDRSGEERGL